MIAAGHTENVNGLSYNHVGMMMLNNVWLS